MSTMRDTVGFVSRRRSVVAAALFASALFFLPSHASADSDRVRFLAERMKDSNSQVRTSAALQLGKTGDDGAVSPLCGGLNDSEDVVRQASASALKSLGNPRAVSCLNARLSVEPSDSVKAAIQRALDALGGGSGNSGAIKDNPNAKYYISLSPVANQTSRPSSDIERIVLKSVRAKLDDAGTVQLAPSGESADKARAAIKDRKLKGGFYLAIGVDQFQYTGGNLKVKVKIGVFSYPSKSLLGNVDKSLTAQGVSPGDTSSEDRLLDLAAGLASEQFAQNAQAFL